MIELKNLVKRYGEHVAVDHINLTITPGKIYGFLGPNGAGKTTTMNMMTGYLAPTEGEVIINGHNILEEPEEAKKCIGYLPEQPPLYLDMTVKEYLVFCAQLKDIPKADRAPQIEQVLHMTKLTDVAGRLIKNLSKGYRQRVGLAQAILGFPEIIILDEPTVGLDPKQIIEIRELIARLAKDHTVILSSHILSEVQAVCDHIVIIHHGRLLADDDKDVLEDNLRGSSVIELTARSSVRAVRELLHKVPNLKNVRVAESHGLVEVTLESADRSDPCEALFFAFSKAGIPLLKLYSNSATLEQVFLKLTEDTVTDADLIRQQNIQADEASSSGPETEQPAEDDTVEIEITEDAPDSSDDTETEGQA